ncbi:MAG: S41 family peptidase [Defluviitaleaceae bacterium]|nr:S41 family peptidase [Defluviitaleaceae bacterium]
MKKARKVIVALVLAFIMAAVPVVPFFQPVAVAAQELSMEEQGFVSIRDIFEAEGGVVTWVRTPRSIHIAILGGTIVFVPGSNIVVINDVNVEIEFPVALFEGTAYIFIDDLLFVIDMFNYLNQTEPGHTFYLTPEARDIVLEDFDYAVAAILENTPWESVINRRLDMDFVEYVTILREHIYLMDSLTLPLTLEAYEELLGVPIYEVAFPIRDTDDPLDIAADYLAYLLALTMDLHVFEGIGHIGPRSLDMFEILYRAIRISDYHDSIDPETQPHNAARLATFTHPLVRWFYGEVEVDFYIEGGATAAFPNVPGNIVTEIIAPGEIAYFGIQSFLANPDYDNLITIPFFEEIYDFDHLIIDIRGNGGGLMNYFDANILPWLVNETSLLVTHEFFAGGNYAVDHFEGLLHFLTILIEEYEWQDYFYVEIMSATDFIAEQEMVAFNRNDLARLEYAYVTRSWVFPDTYRNTFQGKVWLLIDEGVASASSAATLMLMNLGIATVVGTNTSGVMAAQHVYVMLPNTGLLFRIDIGYMADYFGNSLEAYGIAPHVFNIEGMDALETVLELIAAWEAELVEDVEEVEEVEEPEL